MSMLHISLFSGIGGFDLASEWMGWQNIVSCEINPFSRKVLQHYWPNSYHHDDIHTLTYEKINQELTKKYGSNWRTNDIILTGGFPCQPYSVAGKRLGKEDERHLWPHMLRAIREIQPTWIVGENVRGLISWNDGMVFDEVHSDLENIGFEVIPFILPACGVNAPHRRERVWFVAYSASQQSERVQSEQRNFSQQEERQLGGICSQNGDWTASYADSQRHEECQLASQSNKQERQYCKTNLGVQPGSWENFPTQSPVLPGNDGIPSKLDGITFSKWREESIRAAGNAVVPQVVLQIFKAIQAVNDAHRQPK